MIKVYETPSLLPNKGSVVICPCVLTPLLGGLVVRFAHESAILHQVVLVPRGQLPFAHDAGEAVQVIDEVLRPAHHLRRRDTLLACCAFGSKSPLGKQQGSISI